MYVRTKRFAPRAASAARCARSQGRIEQNSNKADRDVHDFRCKLTTCKCQELPCSRKTTQKPHACTKYIEKGRRERRAVYLVGNGNEGKSLASLRASHQLKVLCEWLYIFVLVGRADKRLLQHLEVVFCRVRTEPYPRYFPGYYPYRNLCKFSSTTFIPAAYPELV